MTAAPPPGAVFLSIQGLRGAADQDAVQAAIRRCDPGARLWTDWPRGLVAVEAAAPAEALRLAVQDAGFIAALLPAEAALARPRSAGAMVARVIGFGFAGAVLGGLGGAVAGLAMLVLDPACRSAGDAGGCAMGIPGFVVAAALLGAPAGVLLALLRQAGR